MQLGNILAIPVCVTIAIVIGTNRSRAMLRANPALRVEYILSRTPHLWAAVLIPALLAALSLWVARHDEWIWNMPFWVQLHYQESIWTAIFSLMTYVFAFSVTAYRQLAHADRHRVLALALALSGIVGFVGVKASYEAPVKLGSPRKSKDGVILQSTMSSCAAAAAANIAIYHGLDKSEADFARLFQTTTEGTLPAQIAMGFKRLGFQVTKRTAPNRDVAAIQPPAILLVTEDTHAVAFVGISNGVAEILDPIGGRRTVPAIHFRGQWAGHALEIKPGENLSRNGKQR